MKKGIITIIAILASVVLWAQTQPSVLDELKIKNGKTIIVYSNGTWKEKVFKKPTIAWVSIPAGTFTMGSPTSEVDRGSDETQHQVTLSAFKMSKYEVTVGQYRLYSAATGVSMPEAPVWGWNDDDPMCMVTQYDASEFAKWMGCRLPTEAEWEYACRAGTKTRFWFGDLPDKEDRDKYMLFNQETPTADNYPELFSAILLTNSKNRQGNAWGLVDMHGSMWEWCSDWYGDYSTSAQTNPKGATTGSDRVLRGGGWRYDAISCRSAFRYSGTPDYRGDGMGFRLVSPK